MDNIQASLAKHNLTMNNLVKCTVMLADIKDWPAFNQIYQSYFPKHFPARSAFATNGLAPQLTEFIQLKQQPTTDMLPVLNKNLFL